LKPGELILKNPRDPVTEEQYRRSTSLIQAISDLFEGRTASPRLPKGIEKIQRVTLEAVRIEFADKIDEELLSQIAEEEGYAVKDGTFAVRIVKQGAIIARVGSRSDAGGRYNLFVYLFPPEISRMSVYRRMQAEREGILDPSNGKIKLEKLHNFNLDVVKLASKYQRKRYT
jgi:hypothetical protein